RGYDSAGLATMAGSRLHLRRRPGRIANLDRFLHEKPAPGCHGISHTRWATHGPAGERHAHPPVRGDGAVAGVPHRRLHNHAALKRQLQDQGVRFTSDTDTEVLAQLIAQYLTDDDLVEAVRKALAQVKGTYGLAVVSPRNPDLIVTARLGSPLVIGIGAGEH